MHHFCLESSFSLCLSLTYWCACFKSNVSVLPSPLRPKNFLLALFYIRKGFVTAGNVLRSAAIGSFVRIIRSLDEGRYRRMRKIQSVT